MPRRTIEMDAADFMQAIGLLVRRVRAAAASHQLSLTESAVMARLAKYGPATAADLARAESMKPQSMAAAIAVLEEMGLVERHPHPTDRRQMNIALTPKGVAVRQSMRDAKYNWLAQAVAHLDRSEQKTLFAAGEIIQRLAEQGTEGGIGTIGERRG